MHPDSYCFIQIHNKSLDADVGLLKADVEFYKDYFAKFDNVVEYKIAQENHIMLDDNGQHDVSDFIILEHWHKPSVLPV